MNSNFMRRILSILGTPLMLCVSGVLVLASTAYAGDISSDNFQILAPVIMASGGGYASSTSFSVQSVISEFVHDVLRAPLPLR